ncbi:MAG: hypothetical protein C0593_11080 [Marinilabiliales bacterium]|jgi:hypothetical protein|nr:MAG: hypothetical protein C0593_11080 [Marinilabiliales bacterium]
MATHHNITLSGQDSMHKLERFAEEVSNYYHLDDTYFSNVIMCLDALKSFCEQGYQGEEWLIEIDVFSERKGLVFSVKDEGGVLSPSMVPEQVTPELLDQEAGELLFTLGSLSDVMEGNEENGTVELIFSTHSMHRELSLKRAALLNEYFHQGVEVRSN